MKIAELLSDIRTQDLVLPEFQREYVWSRDQARQLMVSLVKGYPVGSLLFWKTETPPELKNIAELPPKLGTVQIVLDGQQRLTTLFLLLEDSVPPYYRQDDIQNDPRELFYNLRTGEFQYYLKSRMQGDPLWRKVTDCFKPDVKINVFEIAQTLAGDDGKAAFELAQCYTDTLTTLKSIREIDMPVQVVPSSASITEAIDIFDRVNSQGTKLTDAELALTHVTGKWPEARRRLKEKMKSLTGCHFYFDLTFMTRALTVVVAHRALFPTIHTRTRDEIVGGWARLSRLLDYLATILPSQAFIHSTEDLATPSVLVPLLAYLDMNDGAFHSQDDMRTAIHWLYAAQTWARYTSQTDQRLESDVSIVNQEGSPWPRLNDQIIDQRGRIEVKAADLEGRGIGHPIFCMAAIAAKAQGAVDWFNGAPLGTVFGKAYQLHSHHIFPQSLLYSNGYDADNHLHRKIVNEIANRAFLTAETNLKLANARPEEYLPEIENRFPGCLVKQFIPMNVDLWRLERFQDFLAARRELIARKINEFMLALVTLPEVRSERTADELRRLGESATLEYKSTLRWDVIRQAVNKDLQISVLKTMAAFLNGEGGTLLIGVDDSGEVCGIARDLGTFGTPTTDTFQQTLVNLMSEGIGPGFAALVKVRFENIGEAQVCVADIDPAAGPAYLKSHRGTEFYVRAGNTSRSLNPQDTMAYIENHWQ